MIEALIYGIAWAGMCCLFDYSMWEDNILSGYWEVLYYCPYKIAKVFGLCMPCFGFWFGTWYVLIDYKHYLIFLGVSELIILLFHFIKLFYKQLKTE